MILIIHKLIIILLFSIILNIKIQVQNCENLNKRNQLENNLSGKNMIYKNFLRLYIENREEFYIKGREYWMKINGKKYNDSNIITIQDKLNYILIHESPENKTDIVDKILLRNYSKKILGEDICPPILKIYNNVDEINLNELPEKFVLKCNHGSQMNIICKDKKVFDLKAAKKKLRSWMNINYGLISFEYQYMNINKKIFAEKYLGENIVDYKINCYNGKPHHIRVKKHLNGKNVNNFYDVNWTLTNITFNYLNFIRDPSIKIERPVNLDKMINYSKLLSSEFCYCRVDLYEVNNKVYLGELTFAPANMIMDYNDQNMRIYLGNQINISKISSIKKK